MGHNTAKLKHFKVQLVSARDILVWDEGETQFSLPLKSDLSNLHFLEQYKHWSTTMLRSLHIPNSHHAALHQAVFTKMHISKVHKDAYISEINTKNALYKEKSHAENVHITQ